MKYMSSLLLVSLIVGCSKITVNTFDRRQGFVTDSLQALESKRVSDSARTSDSLLLTRYDKSEKTLLEIEKERAQRVAAMPADTEMAETNRDQSAKSTSSAREVVIDENSAQAKMIDSLQFQVDSLEKALYNRDKYFLKMKDYTFQDKKAYLLFMLKHRVKDTAQIVTFCECMYQQLNTEHQKLSLIMETQEGDIRGTIHLHIKKTQIEMGEIGNLIYALSAQVPVKIEYGTDDKKVFGKKE